MRRGQHAFILMELIVAMTILGIGFAVLFASMSGSVRNIGRLEKFQQRQKLAENLIAELDLVQNLKAADTAQGSLEDGTRWRLNVEPFAQTLQNGDGIVRIVLRLEWEGNSGPQSKTIETYRRTRNQSQLARSFDVQLHDLQ
jgi:type II secretory pathway pseudopilin PulG